MNCLYEAVEKMRVRYSGINYVDFEYIKIGEKENDPKLMWADDFMFDWIKNYVHPYLTKVYQDHINKISNQENE